MDLQNPDHARRKSDRLSQNALAVLGRVIFSGVFLLSGFNNILHFSQLSLEIADHTLIANAGLLLGLGILFQVGGGILVLLGLYTRIGALMLFMFMLTLTFLYHPFWMYNGTAQMMTQLQQFMKNMVICGAALYIVAFGGGRLSLDWLLLKKE